MNDMYRSIKGYSQLWLSRHIAMEAHKGQTRKITETPYFNHCENVADRLARMGLERLECSEQCLLGS